MNVPKKDTFAEHRKATAGDHVPIRQIGGPSEAYTKGFAEIDWSKKLSKSLVPKEK